MPVEVEAKFRARSAESLDALAATASIGFATLGPPATVDEVDRYLDTEDGRLAAAEWACRLRTRGGVTTVSLKGPAAESAGTWHHRRTEVEGPATESLDPTDWPPGDARAALARLTTDRPLVTRFTLRQRRSERDVLVDGRRVGVLSLDRVEIVGAKPGRNDVHVVELELTDEHALDADDFERLADALLARGDLEADPRSKLEHALERLGER